MLTNEIKEYATQIGNKIPLRTAKALGLDTLTKEDFCTICHQLMLSIVGTVGRYRHEPSECHNFQELYVYTFRGEPWEYDGDYWDD